MTILPAALLLSICLSPASAAPKEQTPAPSQELHLWLIPPAEEFEGLEERRKKVEPLLRQLLGEEARPHKAMFETQPADLWAAKSWKRSLLPEDRTALIEEARKIWPGNLIIEEPPQDAASPKRKPSKKATANLTAMAPTALLGPTAGIVYDGASLSAASVPSFSPKAQEDLKDAPAAIHPPIINTLPGAPRADIVPPTPGKYAPPGPAAPDSRPFAKIIAKEAADAKVDPEIIHALITAMGGYKPNRADGGAYGLMMITKGSAGWAGVKGDLRDPETNVRAGARLFAKLLKMFDGDVNRAMAAYRFGAGTVIKSGGIPNRRDVKDFLGAFQKAYRGGAVKPPVEKVEPPASGAARQIKEEITAAIGGTPETHGRQFAGSARWKGLIAQAGATFGVEPALIESILLSESEGRPSLVSSAGARGLMQLMPGTARALGVKNSFDPAQNINGGTRYLKELLVRFHGNKVLAVAAYNAGPNRQSLRDGYVPNIRETVKYVTRVMARYEQITGEKIDSMAYMTGRGQAWAQRETSRLARLWGPAPKIGQAGPIAPPRPQGPAEPASSGAAPTASLPQVPAADTSASATDPSRGRAVGKPWNGRLVDGQRLDPEGAGYRSIRQSRGRFYGTGKLVAGIEWTAKQVHAADPSAPPMAIGDLSAKNGGEVSDHASHENGLDADILVAWKDADGKPVFADDFVRLTAKGSTTHGGKRISFDAARTWLIVKALATNPHMQVQLAFLDQSLINAVLNYASNAGEDKGVISKASRMLEHWKGHSDHIHIRVQ